MVIDSNLLKHFIKTTEYGAYGASTFRGKNDKIAADQAAVDQMRKKLNLIDINGRIVIGEGEMDEAPMLYVNEKVGTKKGEKYDIAVDPLEGTNFTAKNLPNAFSVLAVARRGNLLHAPDVYMEKIAVGPELPKNLIDLDFGVEKNIKLLSEAKNVAPDKLSACVLDRPRHKKIVDTLNSMGVKINFISDGDVAGVITVNNDKNHNDIYLGIGGAPEGVLAAAALSCLNCQMQTRLIFENEEQRSNALKLGINDLDKKYNIEDMVKDDVIFCATGVTDGFLLNGIKDLGDSFSSETFVLQKSNKTNEIIKNINKK